MQRHEVRRTLARFGVGKTEAEAGVSHLSTSCSGGRELLGDRGQACLRP
jgi:hypothetical protein